VPQLEVGQEERRDQQREQEVYAAIEMGPRLMVEQAYVNLPRPAGTEAVGSTSDELDVMTRRRFAL
jgi:hypothetical protein